MGHSCSHNCRQLQRRGTESERQLVLSWLPVFRLFSELKSKLGKQAQLVACWSHTDLIEVSQIK
jgi:hypothetical protein